MIFEFGMFLEFLVALWFGVGALGGMVWMRYGPETDRTIPSESMWALGVWVGALLGPFMWMGLSLHFLALNRRCMELWECLTKER